MTDSEQPDRAGSTGPERPAWEESFSREIEDLAVRAETFKSEWRKCYADDSFEHPAFIKAYAHLIRGHSVLKAFSRIYGRTTGKPETAEAGFQDRFEKTALALSEGLPFPEPVPIDVLYFLEKSIAQGRAQKNIGQVPDPDPIARVLEFASSILDHANLSVFRMDVLDQFPSKLEAEAQEAELPATDAPKAIPPKKQSELPKGHRLGKLEVVRLLGEGGFAQVYLVYYPALKDHRAAKVFTKLHVQGPEHDRVQKAFFDESHLQNRLKHPNIVRVLDVDEHEGYLVLIMEYVDGRTLRSLIEEKKRAETYLPVQDILKIAIDVAKGLAFAHSHLIIHRDIKPENILIDQEGVAKVSDFGLAKSLNDSGERRTTRLGNLIGTPQYMAPEQVSGESYDRRIDLYSLGAVLYHMAYGEPPFTAKDPWVVLDKQRTEKPVPLSELREDFPEELDRIVLQLLEKDPEARYSTAEDLIQALQTCQANLARTSAAAGRRRTGPLATGAALAMFLVAGVLGWLGFHAWKTGQLARRPLLMEQRESISLGMKNEGSRQAEAKEALYPAPEPIAKAEKAKEVLISKDAPAELHEPEGLKITKAAEPPPKQSDLAANKTVPPPAAVTLREQLIASPPGAAESAILSQLLDLFSKHRSLGLARSYIPLAKDVESFGRGQATKSEFLSYEIAAAGDLVRLAMELIQARFQSLARSKEEVRLRLSDGTVTAGLVEEVRIDAITLVSAARGKTSVEFSKMSPEEFLGAKTAPLAELAFQALSGGAGKALTEALLLEKDQERIVLWYPILVRMARLEIQELVKAALFDALEPLAKGDPAEDLPAQLPHYAQAAGALQEFATHEANITPVYGGLVREFDQARDEQEGMRLLLRGQYSKVLSIHPGTQAHPLAAKLLLARFLENFEGPAKEGTPPKTDELLAAGGWLRYGWKLHPDEKTIAERQQFWQLDSEKEGSILRDPAGPRSLIMYEPHPRISEGIVLQAEFEPLGDGPLDAQWRLLVLSDTGRNNYLRFDAQGLGLFRNFTLEPGATSSPLASVSFPAVSAPRSLRTYVLIPGDEGFHVFVDGEWVATLSKKECILPNQLQVAVLRGKLSMRRIQARAKTKP